MRFAGSTILVGVAVLALALAGGRGVAARQAAAEQPADAAAPQAAPNTAQYFDAHIAPLLARHCLECHDTSTKEGRLDLSRKDTAMAGGKGGPVILPGKAAESPLWKSVESGEMPEDRPPLSPQAKQVLREWIDAGAVWSGNAIDPLALTRDGRAAQNWVRRLTVPEYVETVRAAVGVDIESDARRTLPPDLRADGFSNTAYNLNVDLAHIEAYARLASTVVAKMDVPAFAARFSRQTNLGDDDAMRELIARMGKWLLRGPLEEHEVAAFLRVSKAVAAEGGGYTEAVAYVLEAMLQSPRFVYRIEKQRGDGGARPAEPYELASRMSYMLWGGPPDEELMRAADAGELADRVRVAAQVQRMLQDPRTVALSKQFITEWLNLDRLASLRPDPQRFPQWNEQLAADMRAETLAFFEEVAWRQRRPLSDLLNAQVTFATPRLAAHYGLAGEAVAAVPGPGASPPAGEGGPVRVVDGLKALYTFAEGNGDTVRDVSNAGGGDPTHLKIADASAVKWGDQGLTIERPTLIATASSPAKLIDSVKQSKAITIEAWVTPVNATQAGPARIVTLSRDITNRNFTLGQEKDKFEVRFRTTATSANGQPGLAGPGGSVQARPTHLVYTRDAAGKAQLYIDGEPKAARDVGGDISSWDTGFRLALANEFSNDRPWLGTLHLVALYDRALSVEDVSRNHTAGSRGGNRGQRVLAAVSGDGGELSRQDLQALYRFDEGGGDIVRDTSGAAEPLDLKIESPGAVKWDGAGLTVNEPTLITAAAPPTRLIEAVKRSKALTLEARVAPRDTEQSGPARIVTLSSGISTRNFTLGQAGDRFEVRLRASGTDANGMPALAAPAGSAAAMRLTHVVYTRDAAGKARLYIDGEERAAGDAGGDLSNWDGGFRLALANESTRDRAWRGTFRRVAIYSRALTPDEIRSHGKLPEAARPPAVAAAAALPPAVTASAAGEGLIRYDLSSEPARGGLLTHGSVLTVGGDDASMVTRGLFVLKDLLYSAVGSAPPGVDTTPVPPKPGISRRAIAEQRLATAACAGCHVKFEPLAFGLERFDGIGGYHERDEHGNTLREDGEVLLPGHDQPVKYNSSGELMDLLAASDRAQMNITRKVAQFALGRPLVESDGPELEKIHRAARANGGTYASVITAIAMSDLVQMTRTERANE